MIIKKPEKVPFYCRKSIKSAENDDFMPQKPKKLRKLSIIMLEKRVPEIAQCEKTPLFMRARPKSTAVSGENDRFYRKICDKFRP